MPTVFNYHRRIILLAVTLFSVNAFADQYRSQATLDDEIKATSDSFNFLEFDSESSLGETSRCQLQYRLVIQDNLYKAGAPQIVQGSVTSDYYENKPINFILNIQPIRLEVNTVTHEAGALTIEPQYAALSINGQDLSKFQLQQVECELGLCIAYAPKNSEEIVTFIKAVQSKQNFDAEIVYATGKSSPRQFIRLSNIPTHGITNPEVRKQFTRCLDSIVKKEVNDISKIVH